MRYLSCFITTLLLSFPAFAVCTKAKFSSLRKEPSASSEKTWVVGKFMPFKEVSRTKHWAYVEDVDGVSHYISNNSLTNDYKCMVVSANLAKAYKGPSKSSGLTKINNFDRYAPLEWVGRKDSWYKAKDKKGRHFWFEGKDIWLP